MSSTRPIVALDARLIGRDGTGDSTYWLGLLLGLSRLDPELDFLLLSNAEPPITIPQSGRFRWITRPGRSSRFWSLVTFPLTARKLGASVLHAQYNLSPLAGKRGVTTIHDVSFLISPEWFKPKDRFLLTRFAVGSARRAARVLTVSDTSQRDMVRLLPFLKDKLRVTPLARNPLIEPVDPDVAREIARDLGVDLPFMLTVGTRWPRKNFALAVEATSLLPASLKHKLIVTGKPGWGEERLGERAQAVGYVSNRQLSALYSVADLYLAPSFYEGFGLPLLEAFACGCPVICSSGGSLPEVAGNAARIVESWTSADWASAIADTLGSPSKLQEMRELGKRREADFSWTETARLTVAAYQEVLNARP